MSPRSITGLEVVDSANREQSSERSDPLVELATQSPLEFARFLRATMLFGGIAGIVVSVPCLAFVVLRWTACVGSGRPLREWIVVHCILHMIQSPIRLSLFNRLVWCDTGLVGHVQRVTKSLAWRASKVLSIITYGWLILGVVWLMNAHGEHCLGFTVSRLLLCASIAKMFITFGMFRSTFEPQQGDQLEEVSETPKGASEDLINLLPLLPCGHALLEGSGSETGCAVCLCEFERGEFLRQLPCGHKFHAPCIDKWLRTRKFCPLCMQDVERVKQLPFQKKYA